MTVAIALVSIWVAYLSGESVEEANKYGGELAELLETHEDRAGMLRILMTAFAGAAFIASWKHTVTGPVRSVLAGVVVVLAVLTGIWVGLAGDAGAQLAWQGISG